MKKKRMAMLVSLLVLSLLLCACSSMRMVVNESNREIPVEAAMKEMAEMLEEKEEEALAGAGGDSRQGVRRLSAF